MDQREIEQVLSGSPIGARFQVEDCDADGDAALELAHVNGIVGKPLRQRGNPERIRFTVVAPERLAWLAERLAGHISLITRL